jgi:hypothetical protein
METLVLTLWFVACGVALLLLPLVWRMSAEQAARGGPLMQRGVVPKVVAATVFGVAFVLFPNWAGIALSVAAAALFLFGAYVGRTGRPQFLVPPPLREL